MEIIDGKKYKHYKGGVYIVIGAAQHSETLEELVVYKSIENGSLWVRPKDMFIEKIEINGEMVQRFQRIELLY